MPNLMQRSATWFGGRIKQVAGRSVVLRRGTTATATITGTVSMHAYTTIGDEGIEISVVSDDWIFTAADVVIRGSTIEPRDGDVIIETLNGFDNTYQVLPVAGRPSVEWLDSSGLLLLVHSKRVDRD